MREQINYLKDEIRAKDKLIEQLSIIPREIKSETGNDKTAYQPVQRTRVSAARHAAELEIREKEDYWKKEIARREAEAASGNTIQVDS